MEKEYVRGVETNQERERNTNTGSITIINMFCQFKSWIEPYTHGSCDDFSKSSKCLNLNLKITFFSSS